MNFLNIAHVHFNFYLANPCYIEEIETQTAVELGPCLLSCSALFGGGGGGGVTIT